MTAFKNTILGKILRVVSPITAIGSKGTYGKIVRTVATVGASVIGAGAVAGIISGSGAAAGVSATTKTVGGALSKVGQGVVKLVTGMTKTEREQVGVIKSEGKAAQDKLDQIERLVNAGATLARAREMVGVTAEELGSPDAAVLDQEAALEAEFKAAQQKTLTPAPVQAGAGCLWLTVLLLLAPGTIIGALILIL